MAKKNFTEYERDLKDLSKKPLAKDRETLIFPPESDIKESDKQNASVLPAAPKLSMRKEAPYKFRKGDHVEVTEGNFEGCAGIVEGIDEFAYWKVIFDDPVDLVELDLYGEYKDSPEKLIDDLYLQWEGFDSSILKKIPNITRASKKKEVVIKIAVDDKILTSSKKKAKVVSISADLVFWVGIEEADFGSDFAEEVELLKENTDFERGQGPFGRGLGPGGVCTCPKCGFTMDHERGVPCYALTCPKCGAKMGRSQKEPVEEKGIVKEIPLEEEI